MTRYPTVPITRQRCLRSIALIEQQAEERGMSPHRQRLLAAWRDMLASTEKPKATASTVSVINLKRGRRGADVN